MGGVVNNAFPLATYRRADEAPSTDEGLLVQAPVG